MKKMMVALPLVALVAACGGAGDKGSGGAAAQMKIVGSSTVYPFTTAIAETFQRANPGSSVIVESTGTGAGIKLFCEGVGGQTPDMVNASRQMKASEYETCSQNGAKQVIEVTIGIDGLTLIQAKDQPALNLTVDQIYKALAADPFGKGTNKAQTWKDVDPSLPATKIRVLGPPPTSGTRDSLAELILTKGCESDPAMKELKKTDEDKHKSICTKIREDGAYIEGGENDNLLVQKVSANAGTIGIMGYSFLEENADKVKGIPINGVAPSADSIANFEYPGSRPLFMYVKGEHLTAVPGIREFIAEFAKGWAPNAYLSRRGMIALQPDKLAASDQQAKDLKPMTGEGLK
jgi:phosphate transport system substrate-binding protein